MLGRLLTLETLNLAWNPILEITGTLMYREKKIVVVLGNPICLTSQKKKKKAIRYFAVLNENSICTQ